MLVKVWVKAPRYISKVQLCEFKSRVQGVMFL